MVSFKRSQWSDIAILIQEQAICNFLLGGAIESRTQDEIQELARLNTSTEGEQYKEANYTIPEVPEGNVENDGISHVEGPRVRFEASDPKIGFNVPNGRSSLNPLETSRTSIRQGKDLKKEQDSNRS